MFFSLKIEFSTLYGIVQILPPKIQFWKIGEIRKSLWIAKVLLGISILFQWTVLLLIEILSSSSFPLLDFYDLSWEGKLFRALLEWNWVGFQRYLPAITLHISHSLSQMSRNFDFPLSTIFHFAFGQRDWIGKVLGPKLNLTKGGKI